MARNSTFPLAGILEKDKLHESGTNFVDWYRNVRNSRAGPRPGGGAPTVGAAVNSPDPRSGEIGRAHV